MFERKSELDKRRKEVHNKILKAEEKYIEEDLDKEYAQVPGIKLNSM